MNALVIGGAACVWDDVRALEAMLGREWNGLVIAANDIGVHWPRGLDHWATLHPEKLSGWEEARRANGHPDGYITWARDGRRGVMRTVRPWGGGSSGLLAVAVAYELGCDRIVLAGVPMDTRPHFAESAVHDPGKPWTDADSHWRAWERKVDRLRERVRSMSGRTREQLGAPTLEWLHGRPTMEAA